MTDFDEKDFEKFNEELFDEIEPIELTDEDLDICWLTSDDDYIDKYDLSSRIKHTRSLIDTLGNVYDNPEHELRDYALDEGDKKIQNNLRSMRDILGVKEEDLEDLNEIDSLKLLSDRYRDFQDWDKLDIPSDKVELFAEGVENKNETIINFTKNRLKGLEKSRNHKTYDLIEAKKPNDGLDLKNINISKEPENKKYEAFFENVINPELNNKYKEEFKYFDEDRKNNPPQKSSYTKEGLIEEANEILSEEANEILSKEARKALEEERQYEMWQEIKKMKDEEGFEF